jgi:hypothetical protein
MRAVERNLGLSLQYLSRRMKEVFGGKPHVGMDQPTIKK